MNASRAAALLVTTVLASTAHAAVDLHLDIDLHTQAVGGVRVLSPDVHFESDLTLGDDWYLVHSGKYTGFVDFVHRRRADIDTASGTRVDYSLYDEPAARAIALAERQREADGAGNSPPAQHRLVEAENAIAMQTKRSDPLHVATEGDDVVFMNDTDVLMRESTATTPVPPAQARMFAQYMRRGWGGHPQILAALEHASALPARLVLTKRDAFMVRTVTISMSRIEPSRTGPVDVAAIPLRPASAASSPLARTLDRGAALTPADVEAARQRLRDDLDADLQARRWLEAYLDVIEWAATTGEPAPPAAVAQGAAIDTDPEVVALKAVLAPRKSGPLPFPELEALRKRTPEHAYLVDLFEIRLYEYDFDPDKARDRLLAALQARPAMAGAYKELGDVLLGLRDAPNAWRSWDIGRRLTPHQPMFDGVDTLEQRLVQTHPEFF